MKTETLQPQQITEIFKQEQQQHIAVKVTFSSSLSLCDTSVGNLPALFRPGPSRRGICLMTDSDARNAAYFLAAQPRKKLQQTRRNVFMRIRVHSFNTLLSKV